MRRRNVLAALALTASAIVPVATVGPVAAATVMPAMGMRLRANDLLVDSGRGVVYASVPTSAGDAGNSIAVIDPATGTVVRSVFGGSDPDQLAMSDDGTTLYVTLDGANAVRQYALPDLGFVRQITLGDGGFSGPLFASDIEVVPGRADAFVVPLHSITSSPSGVGVALVADGVRLPDMSAGHIQASVDVAFGGGQLFGTDGGDLHRLAVTATGVSEIDATALGIGYRIQYAAGRLYTSSGRVVDATTRTLLGTLPIGFCECPFAVDAANGRVYFLGASPTLQLREYDTATFALLATYDVAGSGQPRSLVRLESGSFVYALDDGTTYVASPSVVARSAPPAAVEPTLSAYPYRVVDQRVAATVYDPVRNLVYGTVPATAPTRANTIVTVDPVGASVTASVAAGSAPNVLAISDDASMLYVGIDGAGGVAQFSLPGPQLVGQFSLGIGQFGARVANDIDVMPGQPGTVAVARRRPGISPPNDGAALFDGGVQRPGTTPDHVGADRIAFVSPSQMVAQDTCCSGSQFQHIAVTASGLTETSRSSSLLGGQDVVVAGGLVYGTTGRIVDPATDDIVGQLAVSGLMTVDAAAHRAYVVSGGFNAPWRLSEVDTDTFRVVTTWALPAALLPTSITRLGPGGFAITSQDGPLYLFSPTYPPPPTTTTTTPPPPPPPPPSTSPPPTAPPPTEPPSPPDSYGEYTALPPARLLDTRTGPVGRIGADRSLTVQAGGRLGVPPTDVIAVVLNVTATNGEAPGFLSLFPTGTTRPGVSSVNYLAGQTVPNLVTVPVDAFGRFQLYSSAAADVIVDVQGYYADVDGTPGGRFHTVTPSRLFDTRRVPNPVGGAFDPGETRLVPLTALPGGPPAGTTAVVMNVTVTGPTRPGFLTVHPADQARPLVSNLNFQPGQTVPNLVIVRVPASGVVAFHNGGAGSTHVVADIVGYFDLHRVDEAGRYIPIPPERSYDTRDTFRTSLGLPLGPGGVLALYDDIGASGYVINVTVTEPTTAGFVAAHPYPGPTPGVSTANFDAGSTVANAAYVAVGDLGIAVTNGLGTSHVIVDVFGFFT